MEVFEISELINDLKDIENFLLDIVRHDREIKLYGPAKIAHIDSYQKVSKSLSTLEFRLINFGKTAKAVNTIMADRFDRIIDGSKLPIMASEISVSLKIAKFEKSKSPLSVTSSLFVGALSSLTGSSGPSNYSNSVFMLGETKIPVRDILLDINRLLPIMNEVQDNIYARSINDFDTFRPSNIKIETVNIFIDKAIEHVALADNISPNIKENIEDYLIKVKSELSRESPAWRKIIGSLVIVSTILGGLAVAPEALANVQGAIKEILGTSVEDISPKKYDGENLLPNIVMTRTSPNDPNDPNV